MNEKDHGIDCHNAGFLNNLVVYIGVEGAVQFIYSGLKQDKYNIIDKNICLTKSSTLEDIQTYLVENLDMSKLETFMIRTITRNFNNGVEARLYLATIKKRIPDGEWTKFIRKNSVESTADKHSRSGELIQKFFLLKCDMLIEYHIASADFGGFLRILSCFSSISHIDAIRDAPNEIQFPLLENPLIYPRQYDSKKVAGYSHRELMGIIRSFRNNEISFDELFKGVKKEKISKDNKDQNSLPDDDDQESGDDGNDKPEDDSSDPSDSKDNNKKNNNSSEESKDNKFDYFKIHAEKTLNAEIAALELIENMKIIEELKGKGW